MIDIVLIDKDLLVLQAIESVLLDIDFVNTVKIFESGREFLKSLHNKNREFLLVITEIHTKDISGIDLIAELNNDYAPSVKIIILSSIHEIKVVRQAMKTGASGYLTKNITTTELIEAIRLVHAGHSYISNNLKDQLVKSTLIEDKLIFNLSQREKEVLYHICSGKTIKEAAHEMKLSNNTVQSYYKTVLKKLNINRTAELIVFAIQNGLYNPNHPN